MTTASPPPRPITEAEINEALGFIAGIDMGLAQKFTNSLDAKRADPVAYQAFAQQVVAAATEARRRREEQWRMREEQEAREQAQAVPPPSAQPARPQAAPVDKPARKRRPRRAAPQWVDRIPDYLGMAAIIMVIVAFGLVFFAINGGFSVLGAEQIASMFNETGRVAWLFLSAWTFKLPIPVPLLAAQQPVLPWVGVTGSSLLQVAIIWLKFTKRPVPIWMVVFGGIMSIYDYGTTFFGLRTVQWLQTTGAYGQVPIAVLLTFGLEISVGFVLVRLYGAVESTKE